MSGFRVFHQGALQGATLFTRYTVGGLQPCGRYHAQVVALCGDGVVMDNKTIDTYTGTPVLMLQRRVHTHRFSSEK